MRSLLSLLFSIALTSALVITTPYYQAYEIYYDAPGCLLASIASIELYDSSDQSAIGTDINSICYDGTTCTYDDVGSYERVCVNGEPLNLAVKAINVWGVCDDATSMMPFQDT
jgi:hypothetical protein